MTKTLKVPYMMTEPQKEHFSERTKNLFKFNESLQGYV
jgi:hypothetical protein